VYPPAPAKVRLCFIWRFTVPFLSFCFAQRAYVLRIIFDHQNKQSPASTRYAKKIVGPESLAVCGLKKVAIFNKNLCVNALALDVVGFEFAGLSILSFVIH
jgi:hypothetical protein